MSNLYSKFERGFYFSSFSPSRLNYDLKATLKNEVGLVQGKRTSNRNLGLKMEEFETVGDSEANVIKMECFMLKSKFKLNTENEKNKNNPAQERKLNQESKTLFRQFCFQHGILEPAEDSGDLNFSRQQTTENEGKKGSQSQTPGDGEGAGTERKGSKSQSGGWGKARKKLKPDGDGTRASGGGGGKRPTNISSSSEPESAFSIESTSESEDPPPRNSSTDYTTSTSIASEKWKSKRGNKRRKTSNLEQNEVEKPKKIKKSIDKKKRKSGERDDSKVSFSTALLNATEEEGEKPDPQTQKKPSLSALKPRKSSKAAMMIIENLNKIPREESSSFSISIAPSNNPLLTARESIPQRDSEWLEWSSTEDEDMNTSPQNLEETTKPLVKDKERPIQKELQTFITSTMVLDKINSILGLNPYTKVVRSNQCVQVKWVPKSGEYIGVCWNALLFFTTTLSIFSSLVTIFGYENPLSSTGKIVKIDFAHHLSEALFVMLLNMFLTIWAVSCILELGVHYAEFYSRFNMGICLLKYDVTEGIHEMIVKHLGCIFIFELLLLLLFFQGYAHTSIVRESCGFLGYTILRPFNFEIRESIYYPLVEILGLVVFLYCFFCVNLVLLNLAVVAKALGNMSKEFNLRMGYTFGTLSVKQEDGSSRCFQKVIPFKKLYAEHQIITSLIRNISHVNFIVLGAFIFAMVFEIVLSMWLFFDLFLEAHTPYLEGVSIERTANVELAVPLRLQKNEGEKLVKVVVVFAITWLMYWIFGGVLHSAGDNCHDGIEFVRRHGLTLCKNSKERRFILSMINSFSPKNPYWIGRKFQFSRAAFIALMSFVIGASMVTIAFRPERIGLTTIELCGEDGDCKAIKVYKTAEQVVYATLDIDPPFRPPVPPIGALIPPPGSRPPGSFGIYSYNSFLKSPPCASRGTYPLIESTVAGVVQTEWSSPYSQLRLPFLYQMKSVMDSSTVPAKEYILFEGQTIYASAKVDGPWKDCYGENVATSDVDDCHNPSLATPKRNRLTEKVPAPPEKQLIAVNQIPSYPKSDRRFFCCYKYGISSDDEVKVCNMPSKEDLDNNCKLSAQGSHSIASFIKVLEDKREDAGAKDDLASDVPFSDPVRALWTNCFCKQDVSDCNKASASSPTPPRSTPLPAPATPTPQPTPPSNGIPACFNYPNSPDSKKYFIQCKVTHSAGGWKNLKYILYPAIFQKEESTYVQRLKILKDCIPPQGQPPLPSDITADYPNSNFDPAIDCGNNYLSRLAKTKQVYSDDCYNPILFDLNTRWNEKYLLRVAIQSDRRIVCCVDYQLEDPVQSRAQALVCNKPKEFDTNSCEGLRNAFRNKLKDDYIRNFEKHSNDLEKQKAFESNSYVVRCMCQGNGYVKKNYHSVENSEVGITFCRSTMNSF